jgi:hypothetical protein
VVEALDGLGGVALFTAAGLGATALLPALSRLPWPRRLAYAYLLGVGGVAAALYALSHCGGVPLRRPAIFAVAALPAFAGLAAAIVRSRRRDTPARPRRSRSAPARLLRVPLLPLAAGVIAAAVALAAFADAVTDPVKDWDGRMTWSAQARYLRAAGTVDAQVLRQERWYVSHPQYPLLLPVAQAAVLEALAADDDEVPFRALYAAFLPALLLVLYDGARRLAGRDAAALGVLAAAALPFPAFGGEGGAVSAYSDLPLAAFWGGALVLLLRPRLRLSEGITAGVLLAAAALAKNEGAPLAVAALAAAALAAFLRRGAPGAARRPAWRRRAAPLAVAALLLALALALFASWRAGIPNRNDEMYGERLQLENFWPAVVTHLPHAVPPALDRMFDFRQWELFWWIAPVVLAAGWRGLARRAALPLLLAAAAPLALAWAAYTFHWQPAYLARVTWNRFLLQDAVPFFLLFSLALRDVLQRTPLPGRSGPSTPIPTTPP